MKSVNLLLCTFDRNIESQKIFNMRFTFNDIFEDGMGMTFNKFFNIIQYLDL